MADIRAAFKLITGVHFPIRDLYRFEPTEHTTHAKLRTLRDDFAKTRSQVRESHSAMTSAKESLDRVSIGLSSAPDEVSSMRIQSLWSPIAKDHETKSASYRRAKAREMELSSKLHRQEAYFAQSQVLELIQSNRYEITPLSVAKGMAGLPYVTSRISFERCSSLADPPRPGLAYELFQALERAFAPPALGMDDGLERLKEIALS